MPAGTMLDVVGVLDSIGDYTTITLKNGTEQAKRSLVLRDNSNRSIELTMWAEFASEPGDQLSQVRSPQPNSNSNCTITGWCLGCSTESPLKGQCQAHCTVDHTEMLRMNYYGHANAACTQLFITSCNISVLSCLIVHFWAAARYGKVACVRHTCATAASMCCQLPAWVATGDSMALSTNMQCRAPYPHGPLAPTASTVVCCQSMQYDQHL